MNVCFWELLLFFFNFMGFLSRIKNKTKCYKDEDVVVSVEDFILEDVLRS